MKKSIGLLLWCGLTLPAGGWAATTLWDGPGADFNDAANWSAGAPTDDASFNSNSPTAVALSAPTTLNSLTFNPGAASYNLSIPASQSLTLNGAGITGTASNLQTLTNQTGGQLTFHNNAATGNAAIVNDGGTIEFRDNSQGGSSFITNTNGGVINFRDSAFAQNTTITTDNGSTTNFFDTASGATTCLITNGSGVVDFTGVTSASIDIGAIAGSGTYLMGARAINVGNDNTDREMSGNLSGTGASLTKSGSGLLVLSGANTYTGETFIDSGTLQLGSLTAIPVGSTVSFTNRAGAILDLNGYNTTVGGLMGGGSSGGNVLLGTATLTTNIDIGGTDNYLGSISGNGSLIKTGAGTLVLSGINTYTGFTEISQGTLQAGAANTLPTTTSLILDNTAGATFDLNNFNQSVGSVSGGALATIALGAATLTTGGNDASTTYAGAITQGGGSLVKIGTGMFTLSSNALNIVTTTVNDGVFNLSGLLTGDTIVNAGTYNLSGTQTGSAAVNGGTMALTGSLSQSADVVSGASLTGTGSIGAALTNNGHVTPGVNGVGTLSAGSYAGSGALNIVFNGASHNLLDVIGAADVTSGILNITGTSFASGVYSLVTAGSLTGPFAAVNTPTTSAFLSFQTLYTATDVEEVVNTAPFATVAQTQNQRHVATAMDSAGSNTTAAFKSMLGALTLLSADQARAALNQISGDSLASLYDTEFQAVTAFSDQMQDHGMPSTNSSNPTLAMYSPVQLAMAGDDPALTPVVSMRPRQGLWTHAAGLFSRTDGDTTIGSPSSDVNMGGFVMGYDYTPIENWLVGIAGGYTKSSLEVDDRSSSGNSNAVDFGLYSRYVIGSLFIKASFAYANDSNDMSRNVMMPGFSGVADSSFHSHLYSTVAQVGYDLKPRASFLLEPTASLRENHLHQDGYSESGAPGVNLNVAEQTLDSLVSSLGLRISRRFFSEDRYPLTVGAQTAWEHEMGQTDNQVSAQFIDAPNAGFTVNGTPRARNSAALGIDGRLSLTDHLQAYADYSANLSETTEAQLILGGLRLSW